MSTEITHEGYKITAKPPEGLRDTHCVMWQIKKGADLVHAGCSTGPRETVTDTAIGHAKAWLDERI